MEQSTSSKKKPSTTKKNLGQFYTKKYSYIFQDIDLSPFIQSDSIFIEPFCGQGDLVEYIRTNFQSPSIECFDYDLKNTENQNIQINHRDTILNPPSYANKILVTNPPYLAKNKCQDKKYFDLYQQNDLYKCFLETIIQDPPSTGLIIIPLNFWCSIREMDAKLRKRFLEVFEVYRVNVFEEKTFDDTSYTICSILFSKRISSSSSSSSSFIIPMYIYPSKKFFQFELNQGNHFTIGGELYYSLPINSKYKIYRILEGGKSNSHILLKALDDDKENKIGLSWTDKPYYGKNTSRTYASINIEPKLSDEKQKELIERFNQFLNQQREKYHSLFLTNYRESKDIARKRISFDFVYQIIGHLLN